MAELDIATLRKMVHDRVDQSIDEWVAGAAPTNSDAPMNAVADAPATPAPEAPKDKRVVRTKQSGDRVYLLDEKEKKRYWVTSPQVLEKLGFSQADVTDIDDKDFLGYSMGAAIYRAPENANA